MNPVLAEIGGHFEKTPAQVILRWLRQSGMIAIPKSVHEERIRENFDIDGFALSDAQMERIGAMDRGKNVILDIPSLDEVYRLHGIRFVQ